MERVIDLALRTLLVVLAIATAFGVWSVFRATYAGHSEYVIYGLRIVGQSLGGLVVVAALISIRKKLAAIEANLKR